MISLNYFQNQYAVAKTLCLELRPIEKTMEYIISSGILKEDEHRNESYKLVKKSLMITIRRISNYLWVDSN